MGADNTAIGILFRLKGNMMEQKIYLVTGEIRYQPYMGTSITKEETKLVYANSADEAYEKFYEFWEGKSSPYSQSYSVNFAHVEEPIL